MALTPEARAQLDAFKAVKVEHARLLEVDRALTQAIEEHADAAHLLLYGPSGVGKSLVAQHTTERFDEDKSHRERRQAIWIEARPSDTGTYVRLDYYRQVLHALKGHILVKEILVNIQHLMAAPKPTRMSRFATDWLDMREAVEQALVGLQVKAIAVDEAHLLMQGDGRDKPDEQLEWLKSMTNRTNVLYIKYNLDARRREMTPTRISCGRIKQAALFSASVQEELSHVRDSLGILPASGTT